MFNEIAEFEDQINHYDERINHIIFDNRPTTDQTGPQLPTTGDKPFSVKQASLSLEQIKAEKASNDGESKIKQMLQEIDTEFDELDSLLKDIDTLKIQSDPEHREHDEERMSNSSYEN